MRTSRRRPADPVPRPPAPPARGRRAHAGLPAEEPAPEYDPEPAPERRQTAGLRTARRPPVFARPRTVRAKIVALLMVPVVSLLTLWAFATVSTAQDIARLSRIQRIDTELRIPLGRAVAELQAERRAAVRVLADPGTEPTASFEQQGRDTDTAVRRLRLGGGHTVADAGDYSAETATRLRAFVEAAEALGSARTDIGARRATPITAYETYTRVIEAALTAGGALTGIPGADLGADGRVLLEFARAGELLAREDALLATPGQRTAETLRHLTGTVETRRALTEAVARDLPAAEAASWRTTVTGAGYADLTAAEDRALAAGTGRDAQGAPAGWEPAYTAVAQAMADLTTAAHDHAADRADPFAEGALSPAGAAVLLGLAAVAASLVISVRIGRALVIELVSLRNGALEIAHRKLPHAMERLRAGEDIDVLAETPAPAPAEDEIAQVGEALSTVHRAALSAAVERAELASGISGVFVNLARRSQVLVHRQLTLLDSMERRADDPGELGDLFRLDHLTTRMRRHAESLIILSGAAPGRAWRMPVPLTTVVRAAVSEIEDYPRVEVSRLAEAAVVGAAVADLTHLLAELIENATQFSPPHTKVRVTGEPVGTGYALEVEDRGLGMGRDTLADANRRIEQSEALDLFDSDRLGLFVVSRLAARHAIRVHLRTSPYGGTTAVVLLPNSLLQAALPAGRPAPEAAASEPEPELEPELAVLERAARSGVPESVRGATPPLPPPRAIREPVRAAGPPRPRPEPAVEPEPEGEPGPGPAAGPAPERSPALRPAGGAPVTTLRLRGPAGPASPRTGPTARTTAPATPLAEVTELPRRVRQASLVPQLREVPDRSAAPAGPRTPQDPPGRSPEEVRDRMTAYRAGWTRGTEDATTHAHSSEGEQP
ncbi:ATPase [Streptomyces venezuelae]|uniref:histidine kinase n=1 Tax=Streptomyces venezuelae TaxID=54571 RepID=A0A5P2DB88_STRVZ|nr:nitrate- and nitrite sensing domain-containing protein [Streptomyces venezuelae]QES51477.1 ATPase [Streptomyces venezuelae]